jgi:hypothetical protein
MTRTKGIPLAKRPAPSIEPLPGLPDFDAPEVLTLGQAARLTLFTPQTIRDAIRAGELAAFIPRGRGPSRTGPGNGYRVFRADLARWFYGDIIREEGEA